ncbi:MAG: GxxExxY protein, partial [Opitutaceae bacterium]
MENLENQPGLTRSREVRELNVEELSSVVVDAAFHLHRDLGPGLLESVYEAVPARVLQDRGFDVARQLPVPIEFNGVRLDEGFRADLVINGRLVIELKSVEHLALRLAHKSGGCIETRIARSDHSRGLQPTEYVGKFSRRVASLEPRRLRRHYATHR